MQNAALMAKLGARTQHQQCVPLLSHFVTSSQLFRSRDSLSLFGDPYLASKWAEGMGYPMVEDKDILPRVAQYAYVVVFQRDDFDVKNAYLSFIKEELCREAEENESVDEAVIEAMRGDLDQLSVTDTALNLALLNVGPGSDNVLALLARMPFEVYLTTTPFMLLEAALTANGKPDHVTACYEWYQREVTRDTALIDYQPSVERPLVYHLQGIETNPVSLVFTEDDYFDFFKQLAQDLRNEVQSDNRLPAVISGLLGSKSLLLLGYSLYDWSFRSFFRGPFRQSVNSRTRSMTAQFPPAGDAEQGEKIKEYLTEFFKDDKFDLYWGSIDQFARELTAAMRS